MARDFEHLKRAERVLDRDYEHGYDPSEEMSPDMAEGESSAYGDDESGYDRRAGAGGAPGDFDVGDDLDGEGMGANSSVGTGRGTESEPPRHRLSEAQTTPSRITGQSGEGGVRRTYVRALPLKGEASVPLDDVITSYQRRAEESLLREEIPPANRDLVKAYFLAIGLAEESAGSEGKDEQRDR